jgi:hypothetical protein
MPQVLKEHEPGNKDLLKELERELEEVKTKTQNSKSKSK